MASRQQVIEAIDKMRVVLKFYPVKNERETGILVDQFYQAFKNTTPVQFDFGVKYYIENNNEFPTINKLQVACVLAKPKINIRIGELQDEREGLSMRTSTDNPPTKEEYLQLAQEFEDVGYESNAAHMRERAKRLEE